MSLINNITIATFHKRRGDKIWGVKNGSYNPQKPRSMAQVVMKDEKPKTFQNNSQHKSTTYRTRQVEIQEDKELSNEQMSSEGEHEQDDDPEEFFTSEKSVMRIGLEKGLIKKLHPERREKDRESVTPSEKKKKKIEPETFIDEAIQKGK